MNLGIPPSQEVMDHPRDDLPGTIVAKMARLAYESPRGLSRELLAEPTIFEDDLNAEIRWDIARQGLDTVLEALADPRLSKIVTAWPEPEGVFWETNDVVTGAGLMRFSEGFAVAYEVSFDDAGNPSKAQPVLWYGDKADVNDFLAEHPLESEEVEYGDEAEIGISAEYPDIAEIDRLIEKLQERKTGSNAALLGLYALRAFVLLADILYGGQEERSTSGAEQAGLYYQGFAHYHYWHPRDPKMEKRPDTAENDPRVGRKGFIPPVLKLHNQPIRQPKPRSGGKRGERNKRSKRNSF